MWVLFCWQRTIVSKEQTSNCDTEKKIPETYAVEWGSEWVRKWAKERDWKIEWELNRCTASWQREERMYNNNNNYQQSESFSVSLKYARVVRIVITILLTKSSLCSRCWCFRPIFSLLPFEHFFDRFCHHRATISYVHKYIYIIRTSASLFTCTYNWCARSLSLSVNRNIFGTDVMYRYILFILPRMVALPSCVAQIKYLPQPYVNCISEICRSDFGFQISNDFYWNTHNFIDW